MVKSKIHPAPSLANNCEIEEFLETAPCLTVVFADNYSDSSIGETMKHYLCERVSWYSCLNLHAGEHDFF